MNTNKEYIKEKSYQKAKAIYGENLPSNIEKRLKLELDSIIKNNFELKYSVASYVAQKSKEMGYLSFTSGSVGDSFVAYLLEITDFNPISYNLPFEMFATINYNKQPDIVLNISREIEDKIREDIKEVKEEIKIYGVDIPTFLNKLQKITKIHPQDIRLNDVDTLNLFSKADTKEIFGFETDFMINMLKRVKIKNFNDLVCVSALSHRSGEWTQDEDISIDMLISNREDMMNHFMEKNIDKKTAYDITEFIRKGKAYQPNKDFQIKWEEYKEILKKHHIPQSFIESCEKIKYLFPKAHCIEEAKNAFRMAWYKVHTPKAFYNAYILLQKFK